MSMKPTFQELLAGIALVILGILAGMMMFKVIPSENQTSVTFILGALSGALTVTGGQKVADKLTTSSGPNATITTEAPPTV